MTFIARLLAGLFVSLALFLGCAIPGHAGVKVSMPATVDPQAQFVVEVKVRYAGLHGYHTSPVGTILLKAGEQKNLPIAGVVPLLYESVYANVFHPAYSIESSSSDKMPLLLRTVDLPPFQLRRWADLLRSGEPLREGGVGITAGAVKDHFYMILRYFLPSFDREGGSEDLRRHLPLLDKLAAFAETPAALENSQRNMRRFSRRDPDKYVESVIRTEAQYREELQRLLLEIRGWLALTQQERLPMYDWLQNLHKPEYVYHKVMEEQDRNRILDFMAQTKIRGHPRSMSWTNPDTRVRYSISLRGTFRDREKNIYGSSTVLSSSLNPRLGLTHKTRYGRQCYPKFLQDDQGRWFLLEK